ncbi:hypothetical protein RB195_006188 [Necator americanus]|uniref:Endonuclease/exonuclease/phosphatase domain-containing protein n=1 Tax=Necator americanus TaxID=51031 RepID=A0ABR1BV11_NECAM
MTICTYNARTLASDAAIEDLMMQVRKFKHDVIGLTEMRRRHPLNAVYDTGEELFLGTCDSRGVRGVGFWKDTVMDIIEEEYDRLAENLQNCMRNADTTACNALQTDDKGRPQRERTEVLPKDAEAGKPFAKPVEASSIAGRSHIHLPPHLGEDGHAILEVLPCEVRHAIMPLGTRKAPGMDRIK